MRKWVPKRTNAGEPGETGPNGGGPAGAFDDRRHPVRQRCHADARSTLSCTSMRSVRVGSWRCALHNSGLLSPITAFALCTATRVRGKGLCRGRYVMRFHKEPSRDTTFKHTVRRSGFESKCSALEAHVRQSTMLQSCFVGTRGSWSYKDSSGTNATNNDGVSLDREKHRGIMD